MATSAAVVAGALPTSGSQDFTVSGFGTPTACLVIANAASSGTNPGNGANFSVGFSDFTTSVALQVVSEHNAKPSNTARNQYTGRIVHVGSNVYTVAAKDGGVTITLSSGSPSAAFYATVVLFKGTTNVTVGRFGMGTSTSAQTVNVGFRADLVFLATIGSPIGGNGTQVHSILSFGAAHIDADSNVSQGMVCAFDKNAQTGANCGVYMTDSYAVGQYYENWISWGAAVGASASGFTLDANTSAASDDVYYLALELADPDDAFVDFVDSATTATTKEYTGTGFTPQALILGQTWTEGAMYIAAMSGGISIGAADGTREQSLGYSARDEADPTETESFQGAGIVRIRRYPSEGDREVASLDSFGSNGWTLDFSAVTGAARPMLAIAIGDSTAAATSFIPPPQSARFHHLLVR